MTNILNTSLPALPDITDAANMTQKQFRKFLGDVVSPGVSTDGSAPEQPSKSTVSLKSAAQFFLDPTRVVLALLGLLMIAAGVFSLAHGETVAETVVRETEAVTTP